MSSVLVDKRTEADPAGQHQPHKRRFPTHPLAILCETCLGFTELALLAGAANYTLNGRFFNTKSSCFQGQFSIISAFSIESCRKKWTLNLNVQYTVVSCRRPAEAPGRPKIIIFNRRLFIFHSRIFIYIYKRTRRDSW